MNIKQIITLIFLIFLPKIVLSQTTHQSPQLRKGALVIGNGNYISSTLANPENDATAIADNLKDLGFVVFKYENLNQIQMKKAIDEFGLNLKGFDIGLFFYAGHGIQASGYNYLIPVDAQLTTERQVEYDCVQADRILALMEESGTKVNIIILDACRNNPFERSWTRTSSGRGLAFMNAPVGTLIAYSTAPGTTAQDGSGNNSPYTAALIENMKVPGLTVTQIFQNVARLVSQITGKQQIPWISSSLTGDFYLNATEISAPETLNPNLVQNVIEDKVELPDENSFLDPIENIRYKTIRIGNQVWMAENLRTTKLNDGTPIPLVTDNKIWSDLATPGYCLYYNQIEQGNTFGALYNWFVIHTGKLCPIGWHVPTDSEWTTFSTYLGGANKSGGKLKETGTVHWASPNAGATNEVGFFALPGGYIGSNGTFDEVGHYGYWWSSTEYSTKRAFSRTLYYLYDPVYRSKESKKDGFSVRCIRD
jgi:uncharacterized protein (TIGR02145 family)